MARVYLISIGLVALLSVVLVAEARRGIPGAYGDEEPADDQVRELFKFLDAEIKKRDDTIVSVEAMKYRTQVVAGTNYLIRTKLTHADKRVTYADIVVYLGFKEDPELTLMRQGLVEDEPLEP